MKLFVAAITMLALAGCGIAVPEDSSDLTACGDFPASTGDGGPTSRYFVCRDANNGECYYKKTYFEQIPANSKDNCAATTQMYFELKTSEPLYLN